MNDRPFSLQPRSQRRGPQSIAEFIQRAHARPGGFRSLDSAELQRQIDARQNGHPGADSDRDVDMTGEGDGDASEAASDAEEPRDAKDVAAAREDFLQAIHQTHQTAMLSLDFVSLLLSKENPAQAVTTLSQGLRDLVGIGTLGATMLDGPTAVAQSRMADSKMVAIGKRLMDLNKAADTALAASKRLQREIGSETKYWSEVLRVSEAGWQTFRLPREPHTLGVKFGFSNTGPELKDSGIGALRRAKDGSVRLEHGRFGGGSKRLQISILENGVVIGRSSLPRPLAPDAPLEERVKESRDTVFAQELWHEICREGRNRLNRSIRIEGSTLTYDLDSGKTISVQLVTLSEEQATAVGQSGSQDAVANELCIVLGLLLSNAHRVNELRRSETTNARGPAPPYLLLSPLITYYKYDQSVQQCAQSLSTLVSVLRSAGLASSVAMKEQPLNPPLGSVPASTALATLLLKPPPVQFDLSITPASRLRILINPTPVYRATFSVSLLRPLPLPRSPSSSLNPLASLAPPSRLEYTELEALLKYLYRAVLCALTAAYFELAAAVKAAVAERHGTQPRWAMGASRDAIVDIDTGRSYGVYFGLGPDPATGQLQLTVDGHFVDRGPGGEPGKKVHQAWVWPGSMEAMSIVVKRVLSSGPRE
jgi:mediator of RNA polymerase II transcription subunit 17